MDTAPSTPLLFRYAPTPSGFLHEGNLLNFMLVAGKAKEVGGKILLRIDDLDRSRFRLPYLQDIFFLLQSLELPWELGPKNEEDFQANWSQVHRMHLYNKQLEYLKESGHLFLCGCSRSVLIQFGECKCWQTSRSADCWEDSSLSWRWNNANFHFPILRKKGGAPAYHLTSVVDDALFSVNAVLRGSDLLASTQLQYALKSILPIAQKQEITYWHHPVLLEKDQPEGGRKLSKSAGNHLLNEPQQTVRNPLQIQEKMLALLYQQHLLRLEDYHVLRESKNVPLWPEIYTFIRPLLKQFK